MFVSQSIYHEDDTRRRYIDLYILFDLRVLAEADKDDSALTDSSSDLQSQKLIAQVKALKVGPGLEADLTQGSLVNAAAVKKVAAHVKDAISKGGCPPCGR